MDASSYLQFVLALVFVLGLIGAAAYAARRLGLPQGGRIAGRQRRLSVIESLPLDAKRRLVLLRRDGIEHLVLVGPAGDLMIERAITDDGGSFSAALRGAQTSSSAAMSLGDPASGSRGALS
ncbi:MAG: FliO/MopB family protein [Rhodospirillales bacterium]|nr:FliO/MopB family protein [Rhodospirillales bacterium]